VNLVIATDSVNSINLIHKDKWTYKDKLSSEEYPIIANIRHVLNQRTEAAAITNIEYIPAHQDTKNPNRENGDAIYLPS